eukprot:scaffold146913_cov17-Tisochrysis_lutea.AAC.2
MVTAAVTLACSRRQHTLSGMQYIVRGMSWGGHKSCKHFCVQAAHRVKSWGGQWNVYGMHELRRSQAPNCVWRQPCEDAPPPTCDCRMNYLGPAQIHTQWCMYRCACAHCIECVHA